MPLPLRPRSDLVVAWLAVALVVGFIVLGTFYPGEAALIALLLAVVPYFVLRGPITRIARRRFAARDRASRPKGP